MKTNLRRKTNPQGVLKNKRESKALHGVWDLVGENNFKRAAKEYIKEIECKTNIFTFEKERKKVDQPKQKSSIVYDKDELYSGMSNILRELNIAIDKQHFSKKKKITFKNAVIDEMKRRMRNHPLGEKGFFKVVDAARRASEIELKEDIIKYSLF